MTITHEQIFHELGRIHTRLDANAEQRAEMLASIVEVNANTKHIAAQIKTAGSRMEEVAGRVSVLELAGAERKGERGVLAAIMGSKAFAWLVAAFAASAAWVAHNQGIEP